MSYCPHFRRSFLLNEIHLLQFWQHWQNFYKPPHPLWLVYDSYNKTITEKKIDFLVLLSNNKKIILLLCWLAQKKKTAEGKKLIMQPSPTPSHEKRKKKTATTKKSKKNYSTSSMKHTQTTEMLLLCSHHIPALLKWKGLWCDGGLITPLYCPPTFPIMPWLARWWLGEWGEEKGLEELGWGGEGRPVP